MKNIRNDAWRFGSLLGAAAIVAAVAGLANPARADDDDKKLKDKQPAVWGRIFSPDAWKATTSHRAVGNAGDASFVSKNVNLKTWMPLNTFAGFPAGGSGADCWGYTSPSGREYALMGLSWGDGIVEVTNPSAPTTLTVIPGGVNSLWRDITVIGNYAYAGSDQTGVGIQVINLANVDTGSATLVTNFTNGAAHSTSHTILSNPTSGYLYVCGSNIGNGGLNIANANGGFATAPTFTGPGWQTQYVHEAQIVSYTSGPYAGKEIAFLFAAGPYYGASYLTGLAIVDVTNKAAPVTLSAVPYPGFRFCHQGWLTEDRKYLFVDDELDTPSSGNVPRFLTRIFDVSDLANPRMISVSTNSLPSVDHNQYVKGRYLYQSNYTTGLRVWDLSNPLKPYEVAWFDTRPEDDGTGYNGAWGNYPYFNSGTILISDLERGLFITKMSILEFDNTYSYPTSVPPGAGAPITAKATAHDVTIGTVSISASINGGAYVQYPMSAQGGGVYAGNLPATSGFDRIRYYLQASTSEATPRQFTWPLNAANGDVFRAYAENSTTTLFSDNFQGNLGWTVSGTATGGAWSLGVPVYNGGPGAVVGDGDGSGKCYVTGNSSSVVNGYTVGVGVTGGSTILTSPLLDLSAAPEARISYYKWFLSTVGTVDSMVVEISGNNGGSWTNVETVTPASGGWVNKTIRVADYLVPTAQVRMRFTVSNTDTSTTEAGVDGFVVVSPQVAACYANCDGSTTLPLLTANDFQCFLNSFAANSAYANCDGSTTVPVLTANDFQCFLNLYAAGCP